MASRSIAIRITIDNRDAVNAVKVQTEQVKLLTAQQKLLEGSTKAVGTASYNASQLQQGLTNSFLKGNLAARAISEVYMGIKNSTSFVISELSQLELTLTKVRSATGASAGSAEGLKDTIFALGRSTSSSVGDIANASLELAKLGFSGQQLETVLSGVSKLSASLGDSLEQTGTLVGGVVNAFDLTSEQAATVADKLFVTTGKSAASIASFGTAFGLAGNVAANAGVSFEDLAAAIATLSQQGIKASTIGTGLRTFITNLGIEGSKAQQILGGSVQELGLLGAMEEMARLKPDTGTIFEMFGKPGSAVASAIANSTEMFKDFQKAVGDSNGKLNEGGVLINDTILGNLTRLKNALLEVTDVLAQGSVGSVTKSFLGGLSSRIETVVDGVEDNRRFKAYLAGKRKEAGGSVAGGYEKASSDLGVDTQKMPPGMLEATLGEAFLIRETTNRVKAQAEKTYHDRMQKQMLENMKPNASTQQDSPAMLLRKKEIEKTASDLEARQNAAKIAKNLKEEKGKARLERNQKASQGMIARMYDASPYEQDLDAGPELARRKAEKDKKPSIVKQQAISVEDIKQFAAGLDDLTQATDNWIKNSATGFVAFKASVDAVNGSVDILSHYFIEGIFSSKKDPFKHMGDAFGNFAKKMAADLAALMLKIMIFKAVTIGLGLIPGGAGAIPFVNAVGTASTGVKFASGTDQIVTKATSFVAGESGMERVQVTPRSKMGSGGSGGGITVIIQGDVMDGARFTEAVEMAQKRIRKGNV